MSRALGKQHPDYARSLNNLAVLYEAMGRHAEAEPLYRQAMEICRQVLGEQHPDYATSLNNLAGLYDDRWASYAEAEPLYRQAMEISRQALGEQHPDYATSLNNLAVLYQAMGRLRGGRAALPAGDGDPPRSPGRAAPDYATSLNNLAGLYGRWAATREAEPLYRQAMEIRRASPGRAASRLRHQPEQPGGAVPRRWAATRRPSRSTGRRWRSAAQVLGEQHPDYATSLNNLAGLYGVDGPTTRRPSRSTGRRWKFAAQVLGEQHPDYATSLNNLAGLYDSMGRLRGGRAALPAGDGDSSRSPGRAAPGLRHQPEQPGGVVRLDGPHAEAEPLYRQAMEIHRLSEARADS